VIDLLSVVDGALVVGERSSNVVWRIDMDGFDRGEDGKEALVDLSKAGVGSGDC
jgi:hypothetical protein